MLEIVYSSIDRRHTTATMTPDSITARTSSISVYGRWSADRQTTDWTLNLILCMDQWIIAKPELKALISVQFLSAIASVGGQLGWLCIEWFGVITHADRLTLSVGVGRCLVHSVCLSVCSQHNSKTNDPKVFKLGIRNDIGIYSKCYAFGV